MSLNNMMQTQKKATEKMKSGESSLKTHIFKWSPNYLEGRTRFMEAASLFESIGDYQQASKCHEKIALCCEKTDDLSGAAEAYQKIGFLTLQHKKDPRAAYQYLIKSVNMLKIHGNTLKAQDMMKRLGKQCFDMGSDELGAQIYRELIEDMFDDQNYGTGSEIISPYLDFLIEKERYSDVISIYTKHIKYLQSVKKYEHIIARCWLGIICIHILLGEHYIADEKMGTFGSSISKISSSDEYSAAWGLLDAIQKGDEAAFQKVTRRPIFTQMESALVRKLKKFQLLKKDEQKKVTNPLFGNVDLRKAPGYKPKEGPLTGLSVGSTGAAAPAVAAQKLPEEEKKPAALVAPAFAEEEKKSPLAAEPTPVPVAEPEKPEEPPKVEEQKKPAAEEEPKLAVEHKEPEPETVPATEAKKAEEEGAPKTEEPAQKTDADFGGMFT